MSSGEYHNTSAAQRFVVPWRFLGALVVIVSLSLAATTYVSAERISDIRNTRHNFSAVVQPLLPEGDTRNAHAVSESQICAFCHTPHGATNEPKAPLWNRKLSGQTYIPYESMSLDATDLGQPGGKSKLCLSCHDGALALGSVNVLNRVERPYIPFTGANMPADGTIPTGKGNTTGFTRKLDVDLTNDHPISFTFDAAQAQRDGELRTPGPGAPVGNRVRGHEKPLLPLEDNKVECISCHDPHIRDTSGESIKFLRLNRFQKQAPTSTAFDQDNDIICLGCHDKAGWVNSAHANPAVGTGVNANSVAGTVYTDAAAKVREFPPGTQVWQAACLNCHDPHTVPGSRRILREGVDGPTVVGADGTRFKQSGKAAIEETCYTCHSADGGTLVGQGSGSFQVPDIKTDFTTLPRHMPISNTDNIAGREHHDIGSVATSTAEGYQGGKDFVESRANLGKASATNRKGEAGGLEKRHAECTDCHNPHRVTRNRLFTDDPATPGEEGTHNHTPSQLAAVGGIHTNLASGVLRGIWGVEPSWPNDTFGTEPSSFEVKRGDPGVGSSTDVSAPYVTREYQICMKCHSNYSYDKPPPLGYYPAGTPSGTNSMTQYTNQGMEYNSPDGHRGEGTSTTPTGVYEAAGTCDMDLTTEGGYVPPLVKGYPDAQGNCINYKQDNHRAWHPALRATGRGEAERKVGSANLWRTPFNQPGGLGVQTMYCTDCHGSNTITADPTNPNTTQDSLTPVGGVNGAVWGPHGSTNDFLLKGTWSASTGEQTAADGLCFKCHNYAYYGKKFPPGSIAGSATLQSGFARNPSAGVGAGCLNVQLINLHTGHAQIVNDFRCTFCHIAVPHGWKNKNFLANLNDIGPEGGFITAGNQVRNNITARYNNGPYYNGSVLKVRLFSKSGEWLDTNCGSAGPPGNGLKGRAWMIAGSTETCMNLP